ncbi:MAG TPA: YbhB/YbcL family Raf kinase inhibitor-like protein [Methanomicrobiales archaeon]|nr:YbhB/YbcL family Raf kinase inhibitor-like protein [Methanomicrobiales archaeon]
MENLVVQLDFIEFPPLHTCDGGNRSPRITIKGLKATSVALMAVNPYECGCSFCPWAIWNIEPVPVIPPGIPPEPLVNSPIKAVQGTNDHGRIGYSGPCPPSGQTHRYYFKVYGLNAMLDLPEGSDKHELISAMKGHVLQYGGTFAMCTR